MKRSTFLLIAAILAFLFAALMLATPQAAADGVGMAATPETSLLFRSIGGMLLSVGLLNLMVRNHGDSNTLRAVLIFNIVLNFMGMVSDVPGFVGGFLSFSKVLPGHIVHLFIIVGSFIYWKNTRPSA